MCTRVLAFLETQQVASDYSDNIRVYVYAYIYIHIYGIGLWYAQCSGIQPCMHAFAWMHTGNHAHTQSTGKHPRSHAETHEACSTEDTQAKTQLYNKEDIYTTYMKPIQTHISHIHAYIHTCIHVNTHSLLHTQHASVDATTQLYDTHAYINVQKKCIHTFIHTNVDTYNTHTNKPTYINTHTLLCTHSVQQLDVDATTLLYDTENVRLLGTVDTEDNKLRNNHALIHEYFTHFLSNDKIVAKFPEVIYVYVCVCEWFSFTSTWVPRGDLCVCMCVWMIIIHEYFVYVLCNDQVVARFPEVMCLWVCMFVCVLACMSTCIYVYVCMHIHMQCQPITNTRWLGTTRARVYIYIQY